MTVCLKSGPELKFQPDMQKARELFKAKNKIPKLSRVCPKKYRAFCQMNGDKTGRPIFPEQLEQFLPDDEIRRQKSSLFITQKYATGLFPGFGFIAREIAQEEWLSLMDTHKAFHRDHIFHQTQVAIIVNELLSDIVFEKDGLLVQNILDENPEIISDGQISLLDLIAYQLYQNASKKGYFSDFMVALKSQSPFLDIRNNGIVAFNLWRYIARTAAITAALYHDMGYPFQFINRIEQELDPLTNNRSLKKARTDITFRLFQSRLFMRALAGYRTFDCVTRSDEIDRIRDIQAEAMANTHGLPGAISFLSIHDSLEDYSRIGENKINSLIKEISATAILMHDMQKIYGAPVKNPHLRLSFKKDPVSFVVTLADQLQEYGRSSLVSENGKQPEGRIHLGIEHLCCGTRITIIEDFLTIIYQFCGQKSPPPSSSKKKRIAAERLRLRTLKAQEEKKERFNKTLMEEYWDPNKGFMDYTDLFKGVKLEAEFLW